MIDMNKEIIFRSQWTFDGGIFDDYLKAGAMECIARGYKYGLKLEDFYTDNEGVVFAWRGPKKTIEAFYADFSVNYTSESEEKRNAIIEIIRNK